MNIFHIHTWSKWSDPVQTYNSGHKQQWRICTKCNKASFRTLAWDKQTEIHDINRVIEAIQSKN